MKKAFLLCIIFAMLAGCKPEATPEPPAPTVTLTATPTMVPTLVTTESLVTTDYLVKGVWYAEEGLFICPEGAATLAALNQYTSSKAYSPSAKVLLLNTGSGLLNLSLFMHSNRA